MNDKMYALTVEMTGHVLAAYTQKSKPDGEPVAKDIVGDTLAYRDAETGNTLLGIEPKWLKVEAVDLLDDMFLRPRAYGIKDKTPSLHAVVGQLAVNITANSVEVTYPAGDLSPAEETTAWVEFESTGTPRRRHVFQEKVDANSANFTVTVGVGPGTYNVLVLAPRCLPDITPNKSV